MNIVDPFDNYGQIINSLNKGVFLTVRDRAGEVNTMTIAWATLGVIWQVPVLMVMVRPNRYTFALIENADDFTVTFPFVDMKKQIEFCGTRSGRDVDKFNGCGLKKMSAQKVASPIIEVTRGRHYECEIIQATSLDKARLDLVCDEKNYRDNSYHTYYFGKVVSCYEL